MLNMQWKKKGHELDSMKEEILERFGLEPRFFVFGAGKIGRHVASILKDYDCFEGFLDNNPNIQNGNNIISITEYLDRGDDIPIIVSASGKYEKEIESQLNSLGKKANIDYFNYDYFLSRIFPIMSIANWNKCFVRVAQISLTERCTLRCKYCAHGCSAISTSVPDMSFETVKESLDYFFHTVDYIGELVLIGGEPFLYSNIEKIIDYISEGYSCYINRLSITTNGTIIPNDVVLDCISKNNVYIHISNYSTTIPNLNKQYEKLLGELSRFKIDYSLGAQDLNWMDYGFGHYCRNATKEELIEVFDACKTPCREIRGNRYYYCVMARSVSENMGFNNSKDDYLDLKNLSEDDRKDIFVEFELGYSDKGYLDMCNYCRGAEAKDFPIPVAEQLR